MIRLLAKKKNLFKLKNQTPKYGAMMMTQMMIKMVRGSSVLKILTSNGLL
jgi:hypothetical protein